MINGNFKSFLEYMEYGVDVVFKYHNRKYFTQGWYDEKTGLHCLCLDTWETSEKESPESLSDDNRGILWEHKAKEMKDNIREFLIAKIWDGKSFLEIEPNVEWVDD